MNQMITQYMILLMHLNLLLLISFVENSASHIMHMIFIKTAS
jgi:hypothetical protein